MDLDRQIISLRALGLLMGHPGEFFNHEWHRGIANGDQTFDRQDSAAETGVPQLAPKGNPFLWLDAIQHKVRQKRVGVNRALQCVIVVGLDGRKDLMGTEGPIVKLFITSFVNNQPLKGLTVIVSTLMNQDLLVNYSFAKSIYDEHRNFLDPFAPFLVMAYATPPEGRKQIDLAELSEILQRDFQLMIPSNTLASMAEHLNKEGYISGKNRPFYSPYYEISPYGQDFLRKNTVNLDEIKRRQNKFIQSFRTYLQNEENYIASLEEAKAFIGGFIAKNLSQLVIFNYGEDDVLSSFEQEEPDDTSAQGVDINERPQIEEELEYLFLKWLSKVGNEEPELYDTFNEWLRGAVLWAEIGQRKALTEENGFKDMNLYLDTNFLISLLGYHHKFINEAATQLYDQLRANSKIHLKIFSITLQEIFRLLRAFKVSKNNYTTFPVNSVFYFLHCAGLRDSDIDELIDTLEMKLQNLGIEKTEIKEIEPTLLEPNRKELYEKLYRFRLEKKSYLKEKSIHRTVIHDLSTWFAIEDMRSSSVTGLENCQALFLTSSYNLNLFSKKESATTGNFPPVIRDLTLTNILWLKSPNRQQGISVEAVIAIHCKKLIIDERVWTNFIETMQRLRKSNEVNEGQFARMISYNQVTEHYLLRTTPKEISSDQIMDLVKKQEEMDAKRAAKDKQNEEQIQRDADEKRRISDEKERLALALLAKDAEIASRDTEIKALSINNSEKEAVIVELNEKVDKTVSSVEALARQLAEYEYQRELDKWEANLNIEFLEKEFPRITKALKWRMAECFVLLVLVALSGAAVALSSQLAELLSPSEGKPLSPKVLIYVGSIVGAGTVLGFIVTFLLGRERYKHLITFLTNRKGLKEDLWSKFKVSKEGSRPRRELR